MEMIEKVNMLGGKRSGAVSHGQEDLSSLFCRRSLDWSACPSVYNRTVPRRVR
jgi:hypothetical protein